MKLKYFLRGLGSGIIFGAVIMLVAYMTSGSYKLSDKEIISRAEKLGMVFEENDTASDSDAREESDKKTDAAVITAEPDVTDEPASVDVSTTAQQTADAPAETTEETATTAASQEDYVTATITVIGGMGSEEVALLLEDAGIVESAAAFDSFLNQNGYSTRIEIGTFEVNSQMTYEEIADILSTKQ